MQTESPSILLVEDEDTLREAYSRILGERYDISTAATGAAAIDAISADIDIVLLGWRGIVHVGV